MPKGKPWTVEEEKQLRELLGASKSLKVVANTLGKTENAIRQKMIKLGLKEEKKSQINIFSSSNLPEDLPSVEEQLKVLAATLNELKTPGLGQTEVLRLRSIIQGVKTYKELFVDYVDYRSLEAEVEKLTLELEKRGKETSSMARKASRS